MGGKEHLYLIGILNERFIELATAYILS